MDDRGKFIYITQEEYEAVAKFIKQRGKVSITELVESSNQLINMNPDNIDTLHKLAAGEVVGWYQVLNVFSLLVKGFLFSVLQL